MQADGSLCIDAHTHAYPMALCEAGADPVSWARARGEHHWANLVRAPEGRASLQGFVSQAQMCADMDLAGVDRAVLMGWYWEDAATCRWHNDFMREWVAAKPDRFSAFACVQVKDNPDVLRDVEKAYEDGFAGLGELFPRCQGFSMDDPQWHAVLRWAQAHDWPVCVHVEEAVGRTHPGRMGGELESYVRMAQAFPDLRFIFAHWGGGLIFYELNPVVRTALKNVSYDTSATPFLYDERIFKIGVDLVGREKIIFGSDYPLRLYPKKDSKPQIRPFLEKARAQLGGDDARAVFGGNMARLIAQLPSRAKS